MAGAAYTTQSFKGSRCDSMFADRISLTPNPERCKLFLRYLRYSKISDHQNKLKNITSEKIYALAAAERGEDAVGVHHHPQEPCVTHYWFIRAVLRVCSKENSSTSPSSS
jgi:hypothetical protein